MDIVLQSLCYIAETVVDLKGAIEKLKCMLVSCLAQVEGWLCC